jgi:hypothetical protein
MVSHVGPPTNIAQSDIQCLGYRLRQWKEQVFSFGRDGKFTPHLLIKGVKNSAGGTLLSKLLIWVTVPSVKVLFIYPYANYLFSCPIRWLKYSEMYRVTCAVGAVRGSFRLWRRTVYFAPATWLMKHNPNKGNNKNSHHHMAKSCLRGTYSYHLTNRLFCKPGPHCHRLYLHTHLCLWPHIHQRALTLVYQD